MLTYAMIKDNVVVNVLVVNSDDTFDPTYTWVDVTNISPQPFAGYTYDGNNFTAPVKPLPILAVAIANNILAFQDSLNSFIDTAYSTSTRMNFIGIYINAQLNGLINRQTYVARLFPWQNAVIVYAATYIAHVSALTDVPTVLSTTWDFSTLQSSNPNLTAIAALQIPN